MEIRRSTAERLFPVLLPIAVLAAYWPSLGGGFIWDDDAHVTRAGLQGLSGLWSIWTQPGATQQYYPVLHSLFWIEHHLWGDAPIGYHLANAVLHSLAALMLWRLLRQLSSPGAWLASIAFALHPVCVESVAWVSEQKNTLSAVFYLMAALSYVRFADSRRTRSYIIGTCLFVLALLSKSVTATLPAALLVILWFRQGRLSWRRDFLPLLPWFALSAVAALVTTQIERTMIGARGAAFDLGFASRLIVAGHAAWFYFSKALWPSHLLFIYPRWSPNPLDLGQLAYPVTALGALAGLYAVRRLSRAPLAAGLIFVGTLFPALGFINVYPFVFSFVADHFQYLACALLLSFLAAGFSTLSGILPVRLRFAAWAAAIAWVSGLGALTYIQSGSYANAETLYEAVLRGNPGCWLIHDNLGVVLVQQGRKDLALSHFREAMRLNPSYPEAFNNYGNLMARSGHLEEAESAYSGALAARPGYGPAEYDWGFALSQAGKFNEAVVHLRNAVADDPDNALAHYELANALGNLGGSEAAIIEYNAALKAMPVFPQAEANIGLAYIVRGEWALALPHLDKAVTESPSYPEAHAFRGLALAGLGRHEEALVEYAKAVNLGADTSDLHIQMGVSLKALGRLPEASSEFSKARAMDDLDRSRQGSARTPSP